MSAPNIEQLAAFEQVLAALAMYADPESYHAIAIVGDEPCGEFYEDFDEEHGNDFYQRPMPGKRARAALKAWSEATHPDES